MLDVKSYFILIFGSFILIDLLQEQKAKNAEPRSAGQKLLIKTDMTSLIMKSTNAVALMISMWVFSGCEWEVTQAAEPSPRSSFKEWCQKRSTLSAEPRKTVEVLLAQAGTSDCELAAENLLSRTELYLSQTGISDLSPLSRLTNLTKLTLRENQIANVSPLAELTNLQELFLIHNQIADVSPLAGLTNLEVLELSENQITETANLPSQSPRCLQVLKTCLMSEIFTTTQ